MSQATRPSPEATPRMRSTTDAQRKAAAARAAHRRIALPAGVIPGLHPTTNGHMHGNAIIGAPGDAAAGTILGCSTSLAPAALKQCEREQLYFSNSYANYGTSPVPNFNDTTNCVAPNYCGIRKFVDGLPGLASPNDLGQQLPVAVADTTTFPGSDYYVIELNDYTEKMHADLPATKLRGYRQLNGPLGAAQPFHYLGPIIVATSGRPVRFKFVNSLASGAAGNLFIPTDETILGNGLGLANGSSPYLQNRATIHLHGGNTPWISDGTPHQWTIPAGDWGNTLYQRGASVSFVPDMFFKADGTVVPQCGGSVTTACSDAPGMSGQVNLPAGATNDPGHGALTFYYTNQQSGRLLFYHDHAYGITRLNVYAGEAAGYLLVDPVEADLAAGTNLTGVFTTAGVAPQPLIPSEQIPLVIQDKTYVPQSLTDEWKGGTSITGVEMLEFGSDYSTGATVTFTGGCTSLPQATPVVGTMMDPFGQYINGAITGFNFTSYGSGCTSDPTVTIADIPGGIGSGAAAFVSISALEQEDPTWDKAKWGGYGNFWYSHIYVTNQWPGNPDGSGVNPMGRWDYASWFWPAFDPSVYTVRGELPCPTSSDPLATCPGFPSPVDPADAFENAGGSLNPATVHQGVGSTVSATPETFMDTPIVNGTA